ARPLPRLEETPCGLRRRQMPGGDRLLHLGQEALHVVAGQELPAEAVLDHRPEPRPLLLLALAREHARRPEPRAMLLDDAPDLVHAALLERAHRDDERLPLGGVAEEPEGAPVLRC